MARPTRSCPRNIEKTTSASIAIPPRGKRANSTSSDSSRSSKYGAILERGLTSRGRSFREAILEILHLRRDDHLALLDAIFTRHFELLNAG